MLNKCEYKNYSMPYIIMLVAAILLILSRGHTYALEFRASWLYYFYYSFLALLFILKVTIFRKTHYSCHKCLPGLVDRLFILCVVFSPILNISHYALPFLLKIKGETDLNSWLLRWPLDNEFLKCWGISIFFIFTGLGLFFYENYFLRERLNRIFLKYVERYAPLIIGGIIVLICSISFSWLFKVNVATHNEEDVLKAVAYIFNYNFYLILPLLCLLPILTIVSKTGKSQYSTDYFFNFYKILYIENPVLVTFVLILSLTPIALIKFYSEIEVSHEDGVKMWQFSMIIVKVLTPTTLMLPTFAKLIKNFEKSIETHSQVKLRQVISNMHDHVIIFGYGYLGKDVLFELKERGILQNNDVSEVMTPELEKRKVYNNLIIVDSDQRIFKNVLTDSVFGNFGLIETSHESTFSDEDDVLMIGMVGDVSNETILNKIFKPTIKSEEYYSKTLLISTVSDYKVTDKLVKYMPYILCIVACNDLFQYKTFLPKTENDTMRTSGVLYTPYLQGEILGRIVLAETLRWRHTKCGSEELPRILIIGGSKSSYYMQETYLIGLMQNIGFDENKQSLEIYYLSHDEFYKDRTKGENQTQEGYYECSESIRYPDSVNNGVVTKSKVIIGEAARLRTITRIIRNEKERPSTIVINHKNADVSVKLLEEWTSIIISSQLEGYNPKIFIGTKGKEERVNSILKNYEKRMGDNSTKYPMQVYDCMVKVYDDSRELIGSIAETFKRKMRQEEKIIKSYGDQIYIYLCVRNQFGILARLCNNLAKLNAKLSDTSVPNSSNYNVLSFINFRVQNCPGEEGTSDNDRFIIESDVVLTETNKVKMKGIAELDTGQYLCKSLIIPNKQKEIIKKFVGDICFDKNCIHKELCLNHEERNNDSNNNDKEPYNGNAEMKVNSSNIPFARIFICANKYSVTGSIAHVLNNLLFLETIPDQIKDNEELIDLTYIKSFTSFEEEKHKKEFHGNLVTFNKNINEDREDVFKKTFISDITICPITDNVAWVRYSDNLKNFLRTTYGYGTGFMPAKNDKNEPIDNMHNIVIRTNEHNAHCGQQCIKCKRLIENKLDKDRKA